MNCDWWAGKRVSITGEHGFLHKHLTDALFRNGISWTYTSGDLSNPRVAGEAISAQPIDILFHLAARVGGIGFNAKYPGDILYNNLLVDANVIAYAARSRVGKIICVGSTCAYPANAPIPIREESFWQGEPESTNAAYAHAKRILYANLLAHHAQYGLDFAYLVLANLYGEGQDDNPENSHVIPALIRKVLDTSTPTISAWGSGNAVREFLHVSDAVNALILAAESKQALTFPLNIGSGDAFAISDVLEVIKNIAGDTRKVVWDTSHPDGQAARELDYRKAHSLLDYLPSTSLRYGLREMMVRRVQSV